MVSGRKMLRRSARRSLMRIAALAGALSRRERRMGEGWTILTYHRVREGPGDYPFPGLVTPVEVFREQLAWLSERCRVMTVAEALRAQEHGGADHGRPVVCVTFDDGYVDGYRVAAPILEAHGARGTYFVTAGPVGSTARLWFDAAARRFRAASGAQVREAMRVAGREATVGTRKPRLTEWMGVLKSVAPASRERAVGVLPPAPDEGGDEADRLMCPEELRDLVARGHEVGAHTVWHPILTCSNDEELADEVGGARERIGAWIGERPSGFCFPNGDCDDRVVEAVRRSGYAYACTTRAGRNGPGTDRMRLMRIDMNPGRVTGSNGRHDGLAFRAELCLLRGARGDR